MKIPFKRLPDTVIVEDADEKLIFRFLCQSEMDYVVNRINAHDDLVRLAKKAKDWISMTRFSFCDKYWHDANEYGPSDFEREIDAALAKAIPKEGEA